jgi:hypothetical protein
VRDDLSEPADCWVDGDQGRRPGVVTAWRKTAHGWSARVVYTALIEGQWELIEEWLPAEAVHLR